MSIDKKIMDELKRYNSINKYISEQEVPPLPGEELPPPPAGDVPPAGESEETTTEGGSEELDITDLVNSQKNVETKQQEYFDKLFSHIEGLESKLGEMDKIVSLLNTLEQKVEKYRPRTAQEKLELRSLDSGPFNQKLSDFFNDKQDDFEKSGKNEYILTTDEVEDFSPNEIKNTFNEFDDTVKFPYNSLR